MGREVEVKRKDGTNFPFELTICELKVGEKRLLTGIIHDIAMREKSGKIIEDLQ